VADTPHSSSLQSTTLKPKRGAGGEPSEFTIPSLTIIYRRMRAAAHVVR
jgi:hypothetical protein